jgi:poly-gamma-glutamate capsule biosynthesis protein CapA/YwtB (metallophosphatase superfamily)
VRLALAGDTMLGRGVAERLTRAPPSALFAAELVEVVHEADLLVLNLECCVSERGEPWPDPLKPFFFRAPPVAVDALALLGAGCVTVANNHMLDYGAEALLDTLRYLDAAGIAAVGAGPDRASARRPAILEAGGVRLAVFGVSDHPREYAAGTSRPGIALADLTAGTPEWLRAAVAEVDADAVLLTPHWGSNMAAAPTPARRSAAARLLGQGVTLIAGHSAHMFHGLEGRALFDLGDFVDDYAVDPRARNDLGLLFFVDFEGARPVRVEAVPLFLDFCRTRLARGDEAAWIERRFRAACHALGTEVESAGGRLAVELGG